MQDVHEIWQRHGRDALEKVATEEPAQFLKICASLMPKTLDLTVGVSAHAFADSFAQAVAMLHEQPPRLRVIDNDAD